MRISDWSSDVCSSDLEDRPALALQRPASVLAERDVLPADLAHAVRGRCRSGGFEIDDADDLTRGHASKWARRRAIATLFRRARKKRRSRGCPEALIDCRPFRSEEHTSELQSLMRISYDVSCLKK